MSECVSEWVNIRGTFPSLISLVNMDFMSRREILLGAWNICNTSCVHERKFQPTNVPSADDVATLPCATKCSQMGTQTISEKLACPITPSHHHTFASPVVLMPSSCPILPCPPHALLMSRPPHSLCSCVQDLASYPANAWSLTGLLRAEPGTQAHQAALARALEGAEVKIKSSCPALFASIKE